MVDREVFNAEVTDKIIRLVFSYLVDFTMFDALHFTDTSSVIQLFNTVMRPEFNLKISVGSTNVSNKFKLMV